MLDTGILLIEKNLNVLGGVTPQEKEDIQIVSNYFEKKKYKDIINVRKIKDVPEISNLVSYAGFLFIPLANTSDYYFAFLRKERIKV